MADRRRTVLIRRPIVSFALMFVATASIVAGVALLWPQHGGHKPTTAATALVGTSETSGATPVVSAPLTLANEVRFAPDLAVVPVPGRPERIVIPSIQLDAKVVSVGVTLQNGKPEWETAAFAVGYYRGTALPGTRGNTVMAGHVSSPVSHKGDVFRRLPQVRIGDVIDVYSGQERVRFAVSAIRLVPPTALEVMAPTAEPTLTLLTCYPDGVYSERLVVVGRPVDG